MNRFLARLKDILVYPARFYESLTDRIVTLVAGIVLVGVIDFLLPDINGTLKLLFYNKPVNEQLYNAFMTVTAILLLGCVDTLFMCLPLYDIFKYLKKKEAIMGEEDEGGGYTAFSPRSESKAPIEHNASLIKIIKVYVMSHFIIIPLQTALYYLLLRYVTDSSPVWMQNLALILFMASIIWFAAIVTRGINVLFRLNPIFRRLTFIIVFTWNFILNMVFDMQIMTWVQKLFR